MRLSSYQFLVKGLENEVHALLGNEAIARGAVEAGVQVATTYPGTPASEIADTIAAIAKEAGIYMEYSTNEIVALEVAAGASICGARSMTSMKMVGLNVAADAFVTLAYVALRRGLVVVSADDPNCFSSQNEQDNRYYALLANVPCLEPSTAQEAKDMLLQGFWLSEKVKLPVLLRLVTRVCHTRRPVKFGPIHRSDETKPTFIRDPKKLVMIPANARVRHIVLLEKMKLAQEISEQSPLNSVHGEGRLGIITSGVSFNYCMEALSMFDKEVSVLKIGMVNPLPNNLISTFLKEHEPIIVIEELEPYLELQVKAISKDASVETPIYGKFNSDLPRHGELSTKLVATFLSKFFNKHLPVDYSKLEEKVLEAEKLCPPRPPALCAGCPHMASLYAIRVAGGKKAIYPTDIGCYTLGSQPPLSIGDVNMCMGSSAGISCGISKVVDEPVVAVVGDSTFFHAAIPGIINAVYNNHQFVYVVLDNLTTAMTNFQPHPGTGSLGMSSKRVFIEEVARGCGVEFVRVVDPYNLKATISLIKEAMRHPGPAVVVARRKCAVLAKRETVQGGEKILAYHIDEEECTHCLECVKLLGCPALIIKDNETLIDSVLCVGCGVCAQVCPYRAIVKNKGGFER